VRKDHPLRPIRTMVDKVLQELSPQFNRMYSKVGRPSIPPEQLLRALLLQMLYSVRSERLLTEEIDYNKYSPVRQRLNLLSRSPLSAAAHCAPSTASAKAKRANNCSGGIDGRPTLDTSC